MLEISLEAKSGGQSVTLLINVPLGEIIAQHECSRSTVLVVDRVPRGKLLLILVLGNYTCRRCRRIRCLGLVRQENHAGEQKQGRSLKRSYKISELTCQWLVQEQLLILERVYL